MRIGEKADKQLEIFDKHAKMIQSMKIAVKFEKKLEKKS